MIRKLCTVVLSAAALVAMATPASAYPSHGKEKYTGPGYGTASFFAGLEVRGCAQTYVVYGEPECRP